MAPRPTVSRPDRVLRLERRAIPVGQASRHVEDLHVGEALERQESPAAMAEELYTLGSPLETREDQGTLGERRIRDFVNVDAGTPRPRRWRRRSAGCRAPGTRRSAPSTGCRACPCRHRCRPVPRPRLPSRARRGSGRRSCRRRGARRRRLRRRRRRRRSGRRGGPWSRLHRGAASPGRAGGGCSCR